MIVQSLLYFFWISLTLSVCLVFSLRRAQSYKFPQELYFSITGWMLVTIPVGARFLHVFYEEPTYYLEDPIRILEIWKGGFVYFGGLIFSTLFFVFYFFKPRARNFWQTADFFAPALALGTGLGRLACFMEGCCYGKELHFFWAFKSKHPTQLYIFIWEALLFFVLLKIEKKKLSTGSLFLFWIAGSSLGRFFVEFYRDDFRGQMMNGLSISQVISVLIVILSSGTFIFLRRSPHQHKPS